MSLKVLCSGLRSASVRLRIEHIAVYAARCTGFLVPAAVFRSRSGHMLRTFDSNSSRTEFCSTAAVRNPCRCLFIFGFPGYIIPAYTLSHVHELSLTSGFALVVVANGIIQGDKVIHLMICYDESTVGLYRRIDT